MRLCGLIHTKEAKAAEKEAERAAQEDSSTLLVANVVWGRIWATSSAARAYGIVRSTVTFRIGGAAHAFFEMQMLLLRYIVSAFELVGIAFFGEMRKHDETSHHLRVASEEGKPQRLTWHVMVQVKRIVWRVALGGPLLSWVILVPRIAMPNTRGEEIWHALKTHPYVQELPRAF